MSNNMENMLMNMNDSDSDSSDEDNDTTKNTNTGAAVTSTRTVNPPTISQPPPAPAPAPVIAVPAVPTNNPAVPTNNPAVTNPSVAGMPRDSTSMIEPIPVVAVGHSQRSLPQPIGPPPGTIAPPSTSAVTGRTPTIYTNPTAAAGGGGGGTIPSSQYNNNNMPTSSQTQHAQPLQSRVPFEPSMMDIEPTPLRDLQAAAAVASSVLPSSSNKSKSIVQLPPSQQQQQHQQQHQQQRSNVNHPMHPTHALHKPHMVHSTHPTSTSNTPAPTTTSSSSLSTTDHKTRKEQFLMFTRVLMKYLDKQDPNMHTHAKQVIRECAQKNRSGDPGYSSLSISMQKRLKALVGDVYWRKATEYLAKYFQDQYMKAGRLTEDQARRKAHEYARLAASDLSVDYTSSTTAQSNNHNRYMSSSTSSHRPMNANPTTNTATTAAATTATTSDQHNRVVPPPILTNVAKLQSSKQRSTSATPTTEKKKKTYTKKGSASNTPTPSMTHSSSTAAAAAAASAAANREYNILMEMVHHVVDYDVKSCGLILNHESKIKGDLNLTQEQKQLVYGDFGILPPQPQQQQNDKGSSSTVSTQIQKGLYSGPQSHMKQMKTIPSYMKGWGSRNVLSVRAAWAKLRLEEDLQYELEQSSLVLPGVETDKDETIATAMTNDKDHKDPHEWFNEEETEEDDTLALISEATQYYLRTILQGAMHAASQRLNVDGIRLWHSQHQAADNCAKQDSIPFSLRLGCDVQRQVAMAQGNAAKTCQRMEEALSRSSGSKGDIDYGILCNTSSMMELSKIPVIPSAAAKAEEYAKRSFEVYGGKFSGDPPFGRAPKKAKITMKDLNVCLSNNSFAVKRKGFLYRLH